MRCDKFSRVSPCDLLTVGEAFEDLIFFGLPRLPKPGEEVKTSSFLRTFGGGAVITALAAARLGIRCRVLSGLSPASVKRLRSEGVDVSNVRRSGEPYALTAALSTGENRSFVTFNGINDMLQERLWQPLRRAAARHVHFAFYPDRCADWLPMIDALRSRGTTTSWDFGWNEGLLRDPGFEPLMRSLDYTFVNEQECVLFSRRRSRTSAMRYWKVHPRNVVIKLGSKGCEWISPGRRLRAPAPRVRALDTTGAGDAFNGGFLCGILRGMSPQNCLQVANFAGAMSTRAAGGIDGLPRWDQLR